MLQSHGVKRKMPVSLVKRIPAFVLTTHEELTYKRFALTMCSICLSRGMNGIRVLRYKILVISRLYCNN